MEAEPGEVMARFNRDLFNNANLHQVCLGSMAIIDRIQSEPPHVQMASMAATFLMLCDHWKVKPQEAFTAVTNMMNHAEGRRVEFDAVASYIAEELR